MNTEFFQIIINEDNKKIRVTKPSSLNVPKDNSVMFITKEHIAEWKKLLTVRDCYVIWPDLIDIPKELLRLHIVKKHKDPRLGFALFFKNYGITYEISPKEFELKNGSWIEKGAKIGINTIVYPGCYIGSEVIIGNDCYIGSGARIIGSVNIGDNVIIRENTVIGSTDLTTCRDELGKVVSTPQFGGVIIENNVQIGALTVISRGAIDNTIICSGCRIDSSTYISHNVNLGEDSIVVGESILFGSSKVGKRVLISGNCSIRDGKTIGDCSIVGMGSVVVKDILPNSVVKGNPAR